MYKHPSRQKHALPVAHWPTEAEAARSRLFSPLRLRSGLELFARTWVPAMVPWRATDEGLVTPEVLAWYERFARGRPAVIVIEATGIRDVPSGPLLRIGDDRFVPGLAELVRRVREASRGETRLFVQLIDFLRIRRRPDRARYLGSFLPLRPEHRVRLAHALGDPSLEQAAAPIVRDALVSLDDLALASVLDPRELEALTKGERERVTDVHLPHVRDLPRALPPLFADAAARAQRAGFDGVELHYAHAYTMASFLSALNTRDDGYGHTREGRVRLPVEVLQAVRARVGEDFTVGARMLGDEVIEGGSRIDDAAWFAVRLAEAGLDFVSLSTGGKFEDAAQPKVGEAAYPYTGQSGWECMPTVHADLRGPFARHGEAHGRVRASLRGAGLTTPVVTAGGIGTFDDAEGALRRGHADLVAAARQSLADPDWWTKVREGRGRDIRRCAYTSYCEALDQRHQQVTCRLWDREALSEPGVMLSRDGRRRLVAP